MQKHQGSAIIARVVVVILAALAAIYWGYGIYEQNKIKQQAQVASLITAQEKIVLEQRAVHGDLPEQIVPKPIERQAVVERPILQALPALSVKYLVVMAVSIVHKCVLMKKRSFLINIVQIPKWMAIKMEFHVNNNLSVKIKATM